MQRVRSQHWGMFERDEVDRGGYGCPDDCNLIKLGGAPRAVVDSGKMLCDFRPQLGITYWYLLVRQVHAVFQPTVYSRAY
jgi:hypothetical protein